MVTFKLREHFAGKIALPELTGTRSAAEKTLKGALPQQPVRRDVAKLNLRLVLGLTHFAFGLRTFRVSFDSGVRSGCNFLRTSMEVF